MWLLRERKRSDTLPDWPEIRIYYFDPGRMALGVQEIRDGENSFNIFDIEKTVVDIVSFRDKVGTEETRNIIVKYLARKERNLNRLMQYAKLLKCSDVLQSYLDAYGEKERGKRLWN